MDKAQTLLARYERDEDLLTNMDWGHDIAIWWMLPKANVPFLLKDLKKQCNQIVAKLATLSNFWTAYLFCRNEVAATIISVAIFKFFSWTTFRVSTF